MARIFLALAIFASLLLIGNLFFALFVGDFGAASQRYVDAREAWRDLDRSDQATIASVGEQKKEVEQLARDVRRQREKFWPHIWLGIVASLVSLLVNSISVTYFVGTSRWCREVVEAYGMPPDLALESQRLKRRSFPWALTGAVVTMIIVGLGAAADPYSSTTNPAGWVVWHWVIAMGGVAVILLSFAMQVSAVGANYDVIKQILAEAERIRAERRAE